MGSLRKDGFTLIEIIIVITILALLGLLVVNTALKQLSKGRDGKRKADLALLQKKFEDYMNDASSYPSPSLVAPSGFICEGSFSIYLSELPCDPKQNNQYNYLYTYETGADNLTWYKIYTKLENEEDPAIEKVGCKQGGIVGCGPSDNYNYWVGSPNVYSVDPLPGEYWPSVGGDGDEPPDEPPPGSQPLCVNDEGEPYCAFEGACGSCCPDDQPYRCSGGLCIVDETCL